MHPYSPPIYKLHVHPNL